MKIFLVIIFILVVLFLQIGVFPHLAILGAYPNLVLVSILTLSIIQGWKRTLPWIIIGGLFLDFYSFYNILGISVIFLLTTSYLVYFLSQNIFKKTNFSSLVLILLITVFIYNLLSIIVFKVFAIGFDFGLMSFIVGIFYNLIFALAIFYLVKKYVKRFTKIQS